MNFAIIKSSFNTEVTDGLLKGAISTVEKNNGKYTLFEAPGAFEIPLIAKMCAKSKKFDGVICLGCVIKGDTAHFEFISAGATYGLMNAMLETEIPITFGILTTYTDEQALKRSRENSENKGIEAATACIEALRTLKKIG